MLAILAAVMIAAAPQQDTVFTTDGGRLVGTVVEEGPQGVTIQLGDGTYRRLARRDVARIEYADGSVSTPQAEPAPPPSAPPPPRYVPPPPPRYTPPPPPGAYPARPAPAVRPWPAGPISPFYLSFGLGGLFFSGEAENDVDVKDIIDNQVNINFEGGIRLNPHIALALYADLGVGDPASAQRALCSSAGFICDSASSGRFGILLRHTFAPTAPTTPWVAIGTGWHYLSVNDDVIDDDVLTYKGWEVVRLMGGVDFRTSPVFGFGLYGGVSFGRFSEVEDVGVEFDTVGEPFHTTVQAGLRLTLFP